MLETDSPAAAKPSLLKHPLLLVILGAVATFAAVAVILVVRNPRNPIPAEIAEAVSFPLYYPSRLPTGYTFDAASPAIRDRVVFLNFRRNKHSIMLSEQSKPANFKDLAKIDGFSEASARAGRVFYGSNGAPAAVLLTDKTLITKEFTSSLTM
jgi:hypothetical protein